MKQREISIEHGLYGLAFLIALVLRMVNLGSHPLNDLEAQWALQAIDIAKGSPVVLGVQPGYIILTGVLFFVFGSTPFSALFWPALIGSLIIWAPYFTRKIWGRSASLVAAFAFAVDPALTAASRQADGRIIAVACLILGVAFLLRRKPAWAGVSLGIALLGGPSIWMGGVIAVLLFFWQRIRPLYLVNSAVEVRDESEKQGEKPEKNGFLTWQFAIGLVGTMLFAGTLFLMIPTGLSAALNSLGTFFAGFAFSSPMAGKHSIQEILIALVVYEPHLIVLGMWGIISGLRKKDAWSAIFSRWFILAFLLVIIYPGRQVADLVWVVLPLWGLSLRLLTQIAWLKMEDPLLTIGQASLIFVLLGFTWLNLLSAAGTNISAIDRQIRLLTILGALTLIFLITILVLWGWSREIALRGASLGLIASALLYLLFSTWSSAGLGRAPFAELWLSSPSPVDAGLLVNTIGDVSMFHGGERSVLDVTVSGVSSPALRWQLRNMKNVYYIDSLSGEDRPSMVITRGNEKPSWGESYSGQDFSFMSSPAWSLILPEEWLKWALYRQAPMENQTLILWVRSDLMIGKTTDSIPVP